MEGHETSSRRGSISLDLPHPPIPRGPRPSSRKHSSASTFGDKHGSPRTRADRPPPQIGGGRTESLDGDLVGVPLPTRSMSGSDSFPHHATSPGHTREGPPTLSWGSLRSSGRKRRPHSSTRTTPSDSSDLQSPLLATSGSSIPRSGGNVTLPSGPGEKTQPPGRPKSQISRKPMATSGGRGGGKSGPVSVPSPDGMTLKEMMDFFIDESPAIINNVQDSTGDIPTLLEDLVTLGEAIADQAKGASVQFRIQISKFRSDVANLRKFTNVSWYNSVNQIVRGMNELVASLKDLSDTLSN